jgi:hypothetical protein
MTATERNPASPQHDPAIAEATKAASEARERIKQEFAAFDKDVRDALRRRDAAAEPKEQGQR